MMQARSQNSGPERPTAGSTPAKKSSPRTTSKGRAGSSPAASGTMIRRNWGRPAAMSAKRSTKR